MATIGPESGEAKAGRARPRRLGEEDRAALLVERHGAGAMLEAPVPTIREAPAVIDLGALDPADGFAIIGDAASDFAGYSVSDVGDVNNDGFADVIVGARLGDDGGSNAGEAYVVFGKAGGFGTIDLTNLAAADGFIIQGDDDGVYTSTGWSVSAAGDVDGDGFDDVIVGAPHSDGGGFPKSGEAYVVYGKASGFGSPDGAGRQVIDLTFLMAADGVTILGEDSYDLAGSSVSRAGDVNGDGLDDIIVGADGSEDGGANSGAAYVLFGNASGFGAVFDLALFTADDDVGFTIDGDSQDRAGRSVAAAGDVNGDGFDEVIIGAPGNDGGAAPGGGASYVIFGKASGFADLDLSVLAIADGFAILGASGFDNSGSSVAGAGDINGDGYADVVIASPETTELGNDGRYAFVIFGKASGFATIDLAALAPADGFAISYEIGFSRARITNVSAAGDVNGDGFADIIAGVPSYQEAWVIYGKAGGFGEVELETLAPAQGFVIRGNGAQHDAGFSVSGAGDVNDDGYDDLIVGAPGGDLGGGNAGEAYIIFGKADGATVPGGAGDDSLTGTAGGDTLLGMGGSDTLAGGAGADSLDGGSGIDWADYAGANRRITADLQIPANNTQEALGDSYVGIENLRGGVLADNLRGDGEDNRIEGGVRNDRLSGRAGDDTLVGGPGFDQLAGQQGVDSFLLTSADPVDYDRIVGFAANETILLDAAAFGLAPGALDPDAFVLGNGAQDAEDRLIYLQSVGKLFFDPDGAGGASRVLIAIIENRPTLEAGHFEVI